MSGGLVSNLIRKGLEMKADIIIDIETVVIPPTEAEKNALLEAYEPPANYKTVEAILKHKEEFVKDLDEKMLLDRRFSLGGKRMICCGLGRAAFDKVTDIEAFYGDDLAAITQGIVTYLNEYREYRLVGWNHTGFDLPELVKCFAKTKTWPKFKPAKWDIIDIKDKFRGPTAIEPGKKAVGLKEAAKAFGLELMDVAGDDVGRLYEEKKWDEIAAYNKHDIYLTGMLYVYLSGLYSF